MNGTLASKAKGQGRGAEKNENDITTTGWRFEPLWMLLERLPRGRSGSKGFEGRRGARSCGGERKRRGWSGRVDKVKGKRKGKKTHESSLFLFLSLYSSKLEGFSVFFLMIPSKASSPRGPGRTDLVSSRPCGTTVATSERVTVRSPVPKPPAMSPR